MPKGHWIRQKDKETLIELVKEQVEAYQRGEIEKLSTNKDFASLANINDYTVYDLFRTTLSKEFNGFRDEKIAKAKEDIVLQQINALLELVREEIILYKAEKTNRVSTIFDLSIVSDFKETRVYDILKNNLTKEERRFRHSCINRQQFSHEERSKMRKSHFEGEIGIKRKQRQREIAIRDFHKTLGSLTPEQMTINGKKSYSVGLSKLTYEQRVKHGRNSMSLDQRRKNGRKAVDLQRQQSYHVEDRFCTISQQEGATALILEKYIPDFVIKYGSSFQVCHQFENGGIDFLVNGEFLEWHPIKLYSIPRGDIPSLDEVKKYKEILESLVGDEKREFQDQYTQILKENYRQKRQASIKNRNYIYAPFFVASNIEELYYFIARHSSELPSIEDFKSEFNRKVKYVKEFRVDRKAKSA